jgi:hypothetical protein
MHGIDSPQGLENLVMALVAKDVGVEEVWIVLPRCS